MGTASVDNRIPDEQAVIEVRVPALQRLFNAIDPSPFNDKDLDPAAEEFIVGWAKELPRNSTLRLLVHVDRAVGSTDDAAILRGAIDQFFKRRGLEYRRRLRLMFRTGRTSLLIGLAFLGSSIAVGDLLAAWMSGSALAEIVKEGVLIGGWVAMWRPLEIFLYDWWPIRAEARLSDRLAAMPVQIQYASGENAKSERSDSPAVTAAQSSEAKRVRQPIKLDEHRST